MLTFRFFSAWGICTTACCAALGLYLVQDGNYHRRSERRGHMLVSYLFAAPVLGVAIWSSLYTDPAMVRLIAETFR